MRKLLILLLSVLSLTSFAQQKKVAVYVTGQPSGINKVLGDQLVAAFAKSDKYMAVERTTSFLAELGKEQNYQRTGAVSDNEIARLGNQFGVQYVCAIDISDVFNQKYVSARLIDVEKTDIIKAANASSPLNNMNELLTLASNIVTEFTGPTEQEIAQEKARQEAIRKQQEIENERMRRENQLKQTLAKGYIHVGSYYVTFPALSHEGWKQAKNRQKTCNIGGWNDWRFPTETELRSIQDKCSLYGNDYYWEWRYLRKNANFDLFNLQSNDVWLDNGHCIVDNNEGFVILIRDAWK